MLADFHDQLATDKIKVDDEAFKKDIDFIRAMIRFRIDEVVFGIADARRHLIGADVWDDSIASELGRELLAYENIDLARVEKAAA